MTLLRKNRPSTKTKTKTKTMAKTKTKTNEDSTMAKFTPLRLWYVANFKKKYLQFQKRPSLVKYFDNASNDINLLYGSQNRLDALVSFAFAININIVDTICVTFKVKDMSANLETIFAFGYYKEATKDNKGFGDYELMGSNVYISYFVLGGSFLSKDGEYRSGCISSNNLKVIKNTPVLKNILADIVTHFKIMLPKRQFIITKEYFYPTDDKKSLGDSLEYYSYTLQYDIFSLSWFKLFYNLYLNTIENHLNEKYQKIMMKHQKEDLVFFNSLFDRYAKVDIELLRMLVNNIKVDKSSKNSAVKVGQKIIPLSISEVQHPFNLQYKSWREYLISIHLSDFVINQISPGFFITNQWFYIKNSRKGLFDNDIQYEKMERSELAEQITTLMLRAKLYTHENISTKKNFVKKKKKTIESWMSEKFKTLSNKIKDPIDYAKEEIIMSNVALCFMSEYVGRTIMDVITLCKSSKYYNTLVGDPFSAKGYPIFNKYMFDVCYNLFCMNYRTGIIHGDLHLNNVTLRPSMYKNVRNIDHIKNPMILYVLGGAEEQYLLNTVAYNMCIIDFSRSIILPGNIDKLRNKSLPNSYSIISKIKDFQGDQVERLLKLYIHYTTDSNHNKDDLRILFKNKFEAVFKLLSATDIYGFSQKLLMVFKMKNSDFVVPHKSCIDLLEKINKFACHYITISMNNLISDASYEEKVLKMDWPIYTIIKNCFFGNLVANTIIGNIVDVFNINNPIEYSLTKFSMYPPNITNPKAIVDGKVIEHAKTRSYVKLFNDKRIKYEKKRTNSMKVVNYIAQRHKEKHF